MVVSIPGVGQESSEFHEPCKNLANGTRASAECMERERGAKRLRPARQIDAGAYPRKGIAKAGVQKSTGHRMGGNVTRCDTTKNYLDRSEKMIRLARYHLVIHGE